MILAVKDSNAQQELSQNIIQVSDYKGKRKHDNLTTIEVERRTSVFS